MKVVENWAIAILEGSSEIIDGNNYHQYLAPYPWHNSTHSTSSSFDGCGRARP